MKEGFVLKNDMFFFWGLLESKFDFLKFLMVIYLFCKKVDDFIVMGVNFKEYFYVLEKSFGIGEFFYEREDYNYVLKWIIFCVREGRIYLIGL